MKTSDFDYDLPPHLIAQHPLPERTGARMMVVRRDGGDFQHLHVADLPAFLRSGDLLVVNDTRVAPARVYGFRDGTGGKAEALFVEEKEPGVWDALCRISGRLRAGISLTLANGKIRATIAAIGPSGVTMRVSADRPVIEILEEEGEAPLPPYIKRPLGAGAQDRERYQTVYARNLGAVAAPTAGMHFTQALLDELSRNGVERVSVTLHVGPGTFKPVSAAVVEEHAMGAERYAVSEEAAGAINRVKAWGGGRIVAVGTTTVRALESAADDSGRIHARSGRTSLFIYPPHDFRAVDALVTNFHLPGSTLILMVSAFAGRDLIMRAYREAIEREYRFYSFGDCMLIL